MNIFNSLDLSLFHALNNLSGHAVWSDWIIRILAVYVPYAIGVWFVYIALSAWRDGKVDDFAGYCLAVVSAALARVAVAGLIRHYYHHPRPFVALHLAPLFNETSYSFPSGHAIFLFAFSTGIYFVNKTYGRILFGVSTVVCLARIAAGVHYPSDILGGLVCGVAVACLVQWGWNASGLRASYDAFVRPYRAQH